MLSATDFCGIVIRPAFVFGRRSAHFVPYFAAAHSTGKIKVAMPHVTWSELHIDDLVELYVRVCEAPHALVRGQIFNAADSSRNTNLQVL